MSQFSLPVEDCLDTLKQRLAGRDEVILQAPPGAGKTTLVPLALLGEPWLRGKKILMLEPRRIATRSAAFRMASLLNEIPGQTVGYRMRLESKVSARTRIEIMTEGILVRMLQRDPTLEDVGLVIFDEFHERNLDSDLALALCLQSRALFHVNPEAGSSALKILVMSATLDSRNTAEMLNDAPIVTSEGRLYPVDIVYGRARQADERIVDRMVTTIKQALEDNPQGSLLAFLPGQGEIRRCAEALTDWMISKKMHEVHLRPLYGNLSIEEQQKAIAPLSGKEAKDRKVVLATNIAETSLTIEGIDIVVDSGLERESRFNPATGMSGLHTVRISSASSEQRAGRAGRLGPGRCYRLWSAEQQKQLAQHGTPEILNADLAPLALQLLDWGVDDPADMTWQDPPPQGHWQQALGLLELLGALERKQSAFVLSAHGRAMTALPVHPRLAHLLLRGAEYNFVKPAALLASLLSERDPFDHPDIGDRLDILMGEAPCPPQHRRWLERTRQLARQLQQQLARLDIKKPGVRFLLEHNQVPGLLLACAYPDRIARRRHSGGYQLANGRSASLDCQHRLGKHRWLAVAEVSGIAGAKGDLIRSAAALDELLFDTALADRVEHETIAEWDKKTNRFVAESRQKIGALVLRKSTLDEVPAGARRKALILYLQKEALRPLPWNNEHRQWCARVCLLRSTDVATDWPDLGQQALIDTLDTWLGPFLDNVSSLPDVKKLNLQKILKATLSWDKQQRLNELAPARLTVPSGSSIAIDYTQSPPVLAVKLQEMFGCEQTPTVAGGKVALVVHLLSPAGRPLQITQDLAGFWRSSYHDVKKEMKGRYPKHPWPDDPLGAIATRKTR
ncbi:MAG: ATP-dependent helicase HrpB [Gammaproteobacteria bacterium]|nr:ATP-dependent helicase HrpB [Gammaproteobacteria bacterium]